MSSALDVARSPAVIRGVPIKNRIVMAPMTRRLCPDPDGAVPIPEVSNYYAARARGGTGLIITEGVHVNATDAVDAPDTPRCDPEKPHVIASWKAVADAVHAEGGRIVMQLWHTGIFSSYKTPIGPSDSSVGAIRGKKPYRALTEQDMDRVVADFAKTAWGAVKLAGFDGVEVHGAHGYLLDSFASGRRNLRTDTYGGDWVNRGRLTARVVAAVRTAIGPDAPIILRFSPWVGDDFNERKWASSADLKAYLTPLKEAGVDCFHASVRRVTAPGFPHEHPKLTLAGWTKRLTGQPVIAVGSVSLDKMFREGPDTQNFGLKDPVAGGLQLLAAGECDFVAVGRGLLSDPEWGNKVLRGEWTSLKAFHLDAMKARL